MNSPGQSTGVGRAARAARRGQPGPGQPDPSRPAAVCAYPGRVRLELFTSAFCDPCHRAREVIAEAQRLVPALEVDERDVAAHQVRAAELGISSTPTTIIYDRDGGEVLRAAGVPTLPRLLTALAESLG